MKTPAIDFQDYRYHEDLLNREAALNNISNFCFLVDCYLSKHPQEEVIREVLRTYLDKPYFSSSIKNGKREFRVDTLGVLSKCLGKSDYEFVTQKT